MATTRAGVAELYTPIYDEFMMEGYAETSQISPQIFKQINDSTKEWKWDSISGLGEWVDASEGAGGGYEDPTLGYPKTLTQAKFWKKFQVSFEAVDQDEYALLKKQDSAKAMGRGGRMKVERDHAATLYDGFSTTGADSQYLYDTDHPSNRDATSTYRDNLLTGPLSHDNMELAEDQIADNFFDLAGVPCEPEGSPCVLVPPALKGRVARLFDERADILPATASQEQDAINRFAGMYESKVWKYLSAKLGGSDTGWHIVYPAMDMLVCVWNAKPHFTSWIDEDNEYYKYKGRMLYAQGAVDWRFGFASTGL